MSARARNPAEIRAACRSGEITGDIRGLCPGYVVANLVVIDRSLAFDFLLYCQRNQKSCPVIEVTDPGDPEPRQSAPGTDLRTDLPLYAVYRRGARQADRGDVNDLWTPASVAFLIGSGITFDQAFEDAGIPTAVENRWVLNTTLPTEPAGPFAGPLVVTMRWLSPEQAILATQISARFPFHHGAPIHIGDPSAIGADLSNPLAGRPIGKVPDDVVPVFWACGVTPQAAALAAGLDLMIAHAPTCGLVTDIPASAVRLP